MKTSRSVKSCSIQFGSCLFDALYTQKETRHDAQRTVGKNALSIKKAVLTYPLQSLAATSASASNNHTTQYHKVFKLILSPILIPQSLSYVFGEIFQVSSPSSLKGLFPLLSETQMGEPFFMLVAFLIKHYGWLNV
jgi:hypothetical protein